MKLVRVHGERHLSVDEVAVPEAGPHDVVVRMRACGICGSNVHFYRAGRGAEATVALDRSQTFAISRESASHAAAWLMPMSR